MTAIYVALVIYMVVLFGVGLFYSKKNATINDFLLAGRDLGVVAATLTVTASLFGGGLLTGSAQYTYDSGPMMYVYGIVGSGGGLLLAALLVHKMKDFSNYGTITQYLEARYGSRFLRTGSAILSMIALISIVGSQVAAVVGIMNALGIKNTTLVTVVALGERDCSVQRNHQKMIEESPSPVMTGRVRDEMLEAAVRAAQAVGYTSAGTIEFLLDDKLNYYFMEMNTRIQVEHPVTEMVTGTDLVEEMIRVAAGDPLTFTQDDITYRGHAIECRVNAEQPERGFLPSPGTISQMHLPGGNGVRVDTAAYDGYEITPYYDSMIAKVIVHGRDRTEAIAKMRTALEEMVVVGVKTNLDFQYAIMENETFAAGHADTSFIERFMKGEV